MRTAVLSEEIERSVAGRRVLAAAFTSFEFDPKFFEGEVLPVLFSIPPSRAEFVRLDSLQRAIRKSGAQLAAYYDTRGLLPSERSTKLGIPCSAIAGTAGFFHPKVTLLLVQGDEGTRSLLVVGASANLTESGWWRNVEACHVEEVNSGDATHLKQDVLRFTSEVRRLARAREQHPALDAIDAFLTSEVHERKNRSTAGALHVRLLTTNGNSLLDALRAATDDVLVGRQVEIIAPFFDQPADAGGGATAVESLLDWLRAKEARILLPMDAEGRALVSREMHDRLARRAGVAWSSLEHAVGRERHVRRNIHAKLIRIFDPREGVEWLVVGSHNATRAAHDGANFESSFLVESRPVGKPRFWLDPIDAPPAEFAPRGEGDDARPAFVPLMLTYSWSASEPVALRARWDGRDPSHALRLTTVDGTQLFEISPMSAGEQRTLGADQAARMREHLRSTAFVRVDRGDGSVGLILVDEDGIGMKDSVRLTLSLEDILRCWTLLTEDQRAELLDARGEALATALDGAGLGVGQPSSYDETPPSLFASLATTYRAFGQLEKGVLEALRAGRDEHAMAQLFTQADSLDALLRRVAERDASGDPVHALVVLLCAEQLLDAVVAVSPQFARQPMVAERLARLQQAARERGPLHARLDIPDRAAFIAWFEPRFRQRARPAGSAP